MDKVWEKEPWWWFRTLDLDITANFLGLENIRRVEVGDRPFEPQEACHPHQIQDGAGILDIGSHQEGGARRSPST